LRRELGYPEVTGREKGGNSVQEGAIRLQPKEESTRSGLKKTENKQKKSGGRHILAIGGFL